MKWKAVLALSLAVAVFIGVFGISCAEADVTFVNDTDFKVYVATWSNKTTQGWYAIEPGRIWVWTGHPSGKIGYFAKGDTKEGMTALWHGQSLWESGWVHDTKAFKLHADSGAPLGNSSSNTSFREIKLDKNGNATVTLTRATAKGLLW